MYDLPDSGPEFDRGTSLLLAGPDVAVRPFVARCVTDAAAAGEGVVVVLVDDDAPLPDLPDATPVGVVDCRPAGGPVPDDVVVRRPPRDDLAATGVAVSELLATFRRTRGYDRNRVLVTSTAGLLASGGPEATFRFLHVLSGRVGSADALGLVVHEGDPAGREAGTLRPAFDGVVTFEPGADPQFAAVGSR